MLTTLVDTLLTPGLVVAAGEILLRLLPLVSDRANKRAVRLAKAKAKTKSGK